MAPNPGCLLPWPQELSQNRHQSGGSTVVVLSKLFTLSNEQLLRIPAGLGGGEGGSTVAFTSLHFPAGHGVFRPLPSPVRGLQWRQMSTRRGADLVPSAEAFVTCLCAYGRRGQDR